ncbi:MAG: hypothetical protein K0Q81_1375, partial [Paenibacillus sp.]|nr:hypothetical protein [Paenibacillus sp.]
MAGMTTINRLRNRIKMLADDRDEYVKVWLLFGYLFCVVSASTVGRTAADTLFLSRFDNSYLSLMYLPQAIIMIITGVLFQRYAHKVRMDRLIMWLIPILALLVLFSRFGVGLEIRSVFPIIYIAYDVFNFLMIVCFWQFATSVLDQRKAKRMIGIVGSGGITGGIVSGFGLKALVPVVGTANLIFFYAGLQLLGFLAVMLILRRVPEPVEVVPDAKRTQTAKKAAAKKSGLFQNVPHLKYVAILSAALVLSLTLIDYQFKVILRGTLQNEALAGFMGSFYGFSGLIALFVQLFISGRVLTRFGVMTALLVFPIALVAGSLGVLVLPILAMAMVVKGSDKVLGDTIYSSVNQLIMFPIPPQWRNRAKSFLDGVVRNGAKGLAAVCLLVVTRFLAPEQLSYIILVLLGIGIAAAIKVKKAYLQTLLSTLQSGNVDLQKAELNLMDPASRLILTDALGSPDEKQALYALRILRDIETFDLDPYINGLLHHPAPEVCAEALAYVRQKVPAGLEPIVQDLLTSPNILVRAGALAALSAYAKEEHLDEITTYLDDPNVEIQAAAIGGLVKYYGIEGMFRSVGKLKHLIESIHKEDRTAMASLFGTIGVKSFYKPLIALLNDNYSVVRVRALQSAAILRVSRLIPQIVTSLQDGETRRYAVEALAAYEEREILPLLYAYMNEKDASIHLPQVFERLGSQRSMDKLLASYGSSSYEMRDKILESLLRMRKNLLLVDREKVEDLLLQEIQLYDQFAKHGTVITGRDDCSEIVLIIEQIRTEISRRIFQLLSLIYEEQTIQAVYVNWSEGNAGQQANALEVMDQTLQGNLRMELTKMMSTSRKLPAAPSTPEPVKTHMTWLAAQGDDWLRQMVEFVMQNANKQAESLTGGPAAETNPKAYDKMVDLMDRVGLLRNVSLFHGLKSKDLSAIAKRLLRVEMNGGSTIIQEGDQGDCLFIMEKGRAGVYRNEQYVGELKRGDCFGEMAIFTQGIRTATIKADEAVILWRLDSSAFYEMMFNQTSIALEMMKLLSRRLRSMLERGEHAEQSDV